MTFLVVILVIAAVLVICKFMAVLRILCMIRYKILCWCRHFPSSHSQQLKVHVIIYSL